MWFWLLPHLLTDSNLSGFLLIHLFYNRSACNVLRFCIKSRFFKVSYLCNCMHVTLLGVWLLLKLCSFDSPEPRFWIKFQFLGFLTLQLHACYLKLCFFRFVQVSFIGESEAIVLSLSDEFSVELQESETLFETHRFQMSCSRWYCSVLQSSVSLFLSQKPSLDPNALHVRFLLDQWSQDR